MPALEFDRLTKSYGQVQALRGLSFAVRSGEIFGFVGANGAGKTTAMRIALGVLASDGGQVCWDGRPVDLAVRRRIGYMPEERGLYPRMKVADQLVYFARLHGMTPVQAQAAMEKWTDTLGIAARRGDEAISLSLGNQQRVQLAAALVHDPAILVLDEPFSGLDPLAVDTMTGVLRERAAAGVPVLFSSHQLDLVERICDRVGIVKAGEMVAVGGIEELRDAEGERRWLVDGPAVEGWLAAIAGARVVGVDGSRTTVAVAGATDPDRTGQEILAAAMAAGAVREFAPVRPSLVELYRDVVSDSTLGTTQAEVAA